MKILDTHKIRRAIKFLIYKDLSISDQIKISKILNDPSIQLFWQLKKEDRSHSMDVLNRVELLTDELNTKQLALLHDIGKVKGNIGWLSRIFSDLGLLNNPHVDDYVNHEPIGYELIKITSKNNLLIFRILKAPGILLQNITTKQPDDKMIEVSITALKDAFGDEYDRFIGKKYKAEAIG